MVDGFDELPVEEQAIVVRALRDGHVDDDDWRGDVEKNRPGQKGFRLTKADKAQMEKEDDAVSTLTQIETGSVALTM